MTLHGHHEEKAFELPENYKELNPGELLGLFSHFAPYSLSQNEAKEIFKELGKYLTNDEENRIFKSWEHMHYDPGEFYSIIHNLQYKYAPE